jgi:hypothetical protein
MDKETLALLRRVERDTVKALAGLAGSRGVGAQVRAAQLRTTLRHVQQLQLEFWTALGKTVQARRLAVALAAANLSAAADAKLFGSLVDRSELQRWAERAARHAVERAAARAQGAGQLPLSTRVYRNATVASGQLDRLINSALARGVSARDLAGEVRRFIRPATPGGQSFAAMRLARTELNNSFHEASIATYQKPWVDAIEWHLSGSHPRPDACNTLAAKTYRPDGVPSKPHPQCLCFTTAKTPELADFRAALSAGKYDSWLSTRHIQQPARSVPAEQAIVAKGKATVAGAPPVATSFVQGLRAIVGRDDRYFNEVDNLNFLITQKYGKGFNRIESVETVRESNNTYAYVRSEGGDVILGIAPMSPEGSLLEAEFQGYFVEGTGSIHGMLAHEFGHAFLQSGLLDLGPRLDAAVTKADATARKVRGAPKGKKPLGTTLSGYARTDAHEAQAELFSNYHYGGADRQEWVKVWGKVLHDELGFDATPFSELMTNKQMIGPRE